MAFDIPADRQILHDASSVIARQTKSGKISISQISEDTLELHFKNIPSPAIFNTLGRTLDNPVETVGRLPSPGECAVHLEFLETLYALRQRVQTSKRFDKVFQIKPENKVVIRRGEEVKLKDKTLWARRQEKWTKFIRYATIRFLVWWEDLVLFGQESIEKERIIDDNLPPLDVLMVWHSFLLNPALYRKLCVNKRLYRLAFPWQSIHNAIDSNSWTFHLNEAASTKFKNITGFEPNLESAVLSLDVSGTQLSRSVLGAKVKELEDPLRVSSVLQVFDAINHLKLAYLKSSNSDLVHVLSAAVERQSSFVEKMNNKLWVRSPFLAGTIRRAISRYSNFLKLCKLYPQTMFVPTLDIDLAWHTHQCSAMPYYSDTQALAGHFLNHNDKLDKPILGDGMEKTTELYRARFGDDYLICGCWDCEGLIDMLESVQANNEGAIESIDSKEIANKVAIQVAWYRAVEVTRRKRLHELRSSDE